MWALDADPLLLEVLFLASNRRSVEESLGSIPADEYPTRDMLEGYRTTRTPDENLAWSDLFPELCAWLADRERKRKEKEIHAARTRH